MLVCITHGIILKVHTIINKFTAWNEEFTLPDECYSLSDIQDYFQYIFKKHGENTDKPSIQIYVNKIQNRITFKIKNEYSLELLTKETMKLLGSTKNNMQNMMKL